MALKRKFKKVSKVLLFSYFTLSILYLLSIILLTLSLSYLNGIEDFIRIIFMVITFIIFLAYLFYGLIWVFEKKKVKFIIVSLFILIFIPINIIGYIYIDKTYRIIDNINKENVTYTFSLIGLNDSDFKDSSSTSIGCLESNDENDITLVEQLINDNNLTKSKIKKYDGYQELLTALYSKEINAAIIPYNYNDDNFSGLNEETKVLYSSSITIKKQTTTNTKKITEPFTMLLLGVDTTANAANFNGDSIMLITFNPNTLMATFLSIPRDTYVPITCNNNKEAKINSSAARGIKCMMDTITNFTDIDIDYYAKMNFEGLMDLVEAVGGITVDVQKPDYNTYNGKMCEQNSKREFGSKMICLNPGVQTLNGEQALAYARNRHLYIGVDFARGRHQQEVVTAIMNKLKNVRNVDSFYKILNAVSDNMDTNMSTDTILSFYDVGKNIVSKYLSNSDELIKIQKLYLQTTNLTIAGAGSTEQYQKKSLNVIVNAMKNNLDLIDPILTKSFSFDINEEYENKPLGKDLYDGTTRKTLPNFVNQTKASVSSWSINNNIKVTFIDVNEGDTYYNDELENDIVVYQNIKANTLLEDITSITVYTIKKIQE